MNPNDMGRAPADMVRHCANGRGRKRDTLDGRRGIGRLIRNAIKRKYGSQAKAAAALGCSQSHISALIHEISPPDPKLLKELEIS